MTEKEKKENKRLYDIEYRKKNKEKIKERKKNGLRRIRIKLKKIKKEINYLKNFQIKNILIKTKKK